MANFQNAFISYGRADSKALAKRLNDRLVQENLTIWFDFDDIPLGVDYQNQIDDGIEQSDNFLYIISPHSVNSPYCAKEIELALRYHKRVIPILHVEKISQETWQQRHPQGTIAEWELYQSKGLHASLPNLHPEVAKINWIYCRDGMDDFEQAVQGILSILERQKDYVHQHTVLLTQALNWERQQKQSSYLLVGEERHQAEIWLKQLFANGLAPCLATALHCEFITESIKNAHNLMTQAFLSYAEEEVSTMTQIRQCLQRSGLTVWTNKTDVQTGMDFQEAIRRGIEAADNLIYLISPAALASPYCQQELNYALQLNKRIVPLLVQSTDLSQFPLMLRGLQYIDWTDDVPSSESELLHILQCDATYYEEHKRLLTQALKWERQQHNSSILLRGYNLRHAESWLKVGRSRSLHPPLPLHIEFIEASLHQPPSASLDVFISYSRTDSDFSRRLNDALQTQGKSTWFDQESIASGSDFQQEIYQGIENANHFLFVISPNSVRSPYCADEVEYAHKLNKRIVTLLYRPVDPAQLHPVLAAVQWIDFNQREGDFSANFNELVQTLDTDPVYLQTHTRLLIRAIEWDKKDRKESFLLRGDDLAEAETWMATQPARDPQPTRLHNEYIQSSRSVENAHQQANQILKAAATKGKRRIMTGTVAMAIGFGIAGVSGWSAHQANELTKLADLDRFGNHALNQLKHDPLRALVYASISGKTLKTLVPVANSPQEYPTASPLLALQSVLAQLWEQARLEHQGKVLDANFSPDGQWLVTASEDHVARLWTVSRENRIELKGHEGAVQKARFSPDGQRIVTISSDHTARLWDLSGKQLALFTGHQATISSVCFSPNGQQILTASADRTARLWSLSGQPLAIFKGHRASIVSACFSPNGQQIVTASEDKTARLWTVSGELTAILNGHEGPVTSARFSPDGNSIVTASEDKTARIWNRTGQAIAQLQGHQAAVWSAYFSPNRQQIVTASEDKTARVWGISGQAIATVSGHRSAVYDARFSPDGKRIVTVSGDKTARLWDESWMPMMELRGHGDVISRVNFHPDGTHLVTASEDHTARLWNLSSKATEHQWDPETVLVLSPKGQWVLTQPPQGIAQIWSPQKQLRASLPGTERSRLAAFSPDEQAVITLRDRQVQIWQVSGQAIAQFTLPPTTTTIQSLSVSPNAQVIATVEKYPGKIRLWDRTGRAIAELNRPKESLIHRITFSPDGQRLVTAGMDQTARVWDLTGQQLAELRGHRGSVWDAQFSRDGQWIITASADNTARVWDMQGQQQFELRGHDRDVIRASFSTDGERLITVSKDYTAKVWDWSSRILADLHSSHEAIEQHGGQHEFAQAVFSADDQQIVTAFPTEKVQIWANESLDQLLVRSCRWLANYQHRPEMVESHGMCEGLLTADSEMKLGKNP